MAINMKDIIDVDYSKFSLAAQKLKPTVYKDGDSVCCSSGSDPETGVFGCGDTTDQAVDDWTNVLIEKLNKSKRNDDDAKAVRKELGIPEKPIDPDVLDFYNQFKPAKKRK